MSRHSCTFRVLAGVVLSLLFPAAGLAQQTLGGITGVVADPQGGVLSSANVTLVGDETGLTRSQGSGGTAG